MWSKIFQVIPLLALVCLMELQNPSFLFQPIGGQGLVNGYIVPHKYNNGRKGEEGNFENNLDYEPTTKSQSEFHDEEYSDEEHVDHVDPTYLHKKQENSQHYEPSRSKLRDLQNSSANSQRNETKQEENVEDYMEYDLPEEEKKLMEELLLEEMDSAGSASAQAPQFTGPLESPLVRAGQRINNFAANIANRVVAQGGNVNRTLGNLNQRVVTRSNGIQQRIANIFQAKTRAFQRVIQTVSNFFGTALRIVNRVIEGFTRGFQQFIGATFNRNLGGNVFLGSASEPVPSTVVTPTTIPAPSEGSK